MRVKQRQSLRRPASALPDCKESCLVGRFLSYFIECCQGHVRHPVASLLITSSWLFRRQLAKRTNLSKRAFSYKVCMYIPWSLTDNGCVCFLFVVLIILNITSARHVFSSEFRSHDPLAQQHTRRIMLSLASTFWNNERPLRFSAGRR